MLIVVLFFGFNFFPHPAGLNAILMEKESELAKIKQELKLLEPFKVLQKDQEAEIQQLEQQLEEKRFSHEDKIRSIKTQFLKEKRILEEASDNKIKEMAVHANKVKPFQPLV